MKKGRIVNFILEISQVFLVFLGVYSAVMCAALSLSLLRVNRMAATLVLLSAAFLFLWSVHGAGNFSSWEILWNAWHYRICDPGYSPVSYRSAEGCRNNHQYISEGVYELYPE